MLLSCAWWSVQIWASRHPEGFAHWKMSRTWRLRGPHESGRARASRSSRQLLADKATVRKQLAPFRERAELLDFLLEVSAVTSETLDLDRLLPAVADFVHRVIP